MFKNLIFLTMFYMCSNIIYCMERASKIEVNNPLEDINEALMSVGLILDICKIIYQYDGYRIYNQIDRSNGGHLQAVNCLTLSVCGKYMASASADCTIKIFERNNFSFWKCISSFDKTNGGFDQASKALVFSPCGKQLVAGSNNSLIKIFDLNLTSKSYMTCVHTLNIALSNFTFSINALSFSPSGKYLASGNNDASLKIWKKNSKTFIKHIATFDKTNGGHSKWVLALAFSQGGKYLASGSYDDTLKIWDMNFRLRTFLKCILTLNSNIPAPTVGGINVLKFYGKYLVTGRYDHNINIFEIDWAKRKVCLAGILDRTKNGHNGQVVALSFSPCGRYLASGSWDNNNTIKIWNMDSNSKSFMECIFTIDRSNGGHDNIIRALSYSGDGKYLMSGGNDGLIKIWIKMD